MWTVLQIYMFSLADAFEASFILKKVFAFIYRLVILWNEDVCANESLGSEVLLNAVVMVNIFYVCFVKGSGLYDEDT